MISKSYREVAPVTASLLNNNNNSSATSSTSKFPLKTRYQAIDIGSELYLMIASNPTQS